MYTQPALDSFAALGANQLSNIEASSSSGPSSCPSASQPPAIVPLFSDYAPEAVVETTSPLFTEPIMSDSSAEDEMTLGSDPESLERHHMNMAEPYLHPRLGSPSIMGSSTSPLLGPNTSIGNMTNLAGQASFTIPRSLVQSVTGIDVPSIANRIKRPPSDAEPLMAPGMMPMRKKSTPAVSSPMMPYEDLSPGRASYSGPSEGYYYRSRDKTNYSQAHKGALPSPPMTPEAQKRIRCTWNLEETHMLYDLLKDTSLDEFPDAQNIRAHLLRIDPNCNKTLDHVRNKKANLIQKAHSKNITVAEVLLNDMAKLQAEAMGGGYMGNRPYTATSHGGDSPRSYGMPLMSGHRAMSTPKASVRPSRRRLSKRSPPTVLAASVPPAQTATAQQLARMNTSAAVSLTTPSSSASVSPTLSSSASVLPPTTAVPTSIIQQQSAISAVPPPPPPTTTVESVPASQTVQPSATTSLAQNTHTVIDTTRNPSTKPFSSISGTNSGPTYIHSPSDATMRLQTWSYEQFTKLFNSENEVRAQLRLPILNMTPPPFPVTTYLAQRVPIANQWLTLTAGVNTDGMDESETDSSIEESSSGQSNSGGQPYSESAPHSTQNW